MARKQTVSAVCTSVCLLYFGLLSVHSSPHTCTCREEVQPVSDRPWRGSEGMISRFLWSHYTPCPEHTPKSGKCTHWETMCAKCVQLRTHFAILDSVKLQGRLRWRNLPTPPLSLTPCHCSQLIARAIGIKGPINRHRPAIIYVRQISSSLRKVAYNDRLANLL